MSASELVDWRTRASAGDVEAKATLGHRLVMNKGEHLEEGIQWTAAAAKEGNREAAYLMAVLQAGGIGVEQDLSASLAHLQQAAESGHQQAQAELAALVGNWPLVDRIHSGKGPSQSNWRQLRRAVNVAAWAAIPDGQILFQDPRIAAVKKYMSRELCDWVIGLGRAHLERAKIYDAVTSELRTDQQRTNTAAPLDLGVVDSVVGFIRARIAALANVTVSGLENTQVLHYRVGQEFGPHCDYLDPSQPGHARDVERYGQRALTVLIYLNDDYEGGETAFPLLKTKFKGKKGDALIFWNLTPDGAPDGRTQHIGTAPTKGEKWLLSQWIRIPMSYFKAATA
jgi:hypothetical protein